MVVICMLSSPKKRKIDEEEKAGENEDRISKLPDCLLHCIISLLATEDAVATCILSKRWKNLWISVTNLDFECFGCWSYGKDGKMNRFSQFVEMVLLLHSSNIKKFRLSLHDYEHGSFVNSWISAAVRRQVQELCLELPCQERFLLPRCLLRCQTLRTLKVVVSCRYLELPRTIFLPNLTVLHFHSVHLDDAFNHKLFSRLPVLEELFLTYCTWDTFDATISIPTLKSLTLEFFFTHGDVQSGETLRVCAKKLTYFNYTGDFTIDVLLENSPLLVDAYINLQGYMRDGKASSYAANLFNGIRFAKSIRIDMKRLDILQGFLIPKFSYLTSLEVYANGASQTTDILNELLQNSPTLESLVVTKLCDGAWMRDSSTQCPMLCLRTFILLSFSGKEEEISFLKFVLRRCAVLERIKLYTECNCTSCYPDRFMYLSEQLESAIPTGSKSCVIEICDSEANELQMLISGANTEYEQRG